MSTISGARRLNLKAAGVGLVREVRHRPHPIIPAPSPGRYQPKADFQPALRIWQNRLRRLSEVHGAAR